MAPAMAIRTSLTISLVIKMISQAIRISQAMRISLMTMAKIKKVKKMRILISERTSYQLQHQTLVSLKKNLQSFMVKNKSRICLNFYLIYVFLIRLMLS